MGTKPMVVIVKTGNPFVAAEFEGIADAVILHFAIERRPLLDILSGKAEPSGLLPFQMPKDMETVEAQAEDLARDMVPYTDSSGKAWDFAYGLNWQGQIKDGRTARYS
jgi:beta-glucosidase